MTKRLNPRMTLHVAAVAVALAVVGAVAVRAGSGPGCGMLARMHGHMGGGPMGVVHEQFQQIVQKLNLTPEQQAYVDRARTLMESRMQEMGSRHDEEMNTLVAAIGDGTLDRTQVRAKIDAHLDQARSTAYDVSDELVGFVNSLDANQRTMLKDELTKMHESMR
jgi:Spy/CpxP family protein refolding chaperone